MVKCNRCGRVVNGDDEYRHHLEVLCEDCCIDVLVPRVRKMYYENCGHNFMLRLKDSYIARPQQFH